MRSICPEQTKQGRSDRFIRQDILSLLIVEDEKRLNYLPESYLFCLLFCHCEQVCSKPFSYLKMAKMVIYSQSLFVQETRIKLL